MMRFPPRLAWQLTKVQIAQKLFGSRRYPLVLRLDWGTIPAPGHSSDDGNDSSPPIDETEALRESSASIVWIGGATTPLRHSGIAQLARDIVASGRTVFLETDGSLLRRRIHEFRPVSRLYLVLPLNGSQAAHDLSAGQPGNFRATLESIRTAKLSGFHVCVQTIISSNTDLTELGELAVLISKLEVDGWIQTHCSRTSPASQPSASQMIAARNLIPNQGWRTFSQLLDLTCAPSPLSSEKKKANKLLQSEVPEQREEGLRAL
jgi:hypothetical protein